MPSRPHEERFSLGTPGTYRIAVQGALEERFSDRLGGMAIAAGDEIPGGQVTTLTGPIQDQAQLIGVVNALYDLRLPILKVEKLESADGPKGSGIT